MITKLSVFLLGGMLGMCESAKRTVAMTVDDLPYASGNMILKDGDSHRETAFLESLERGEWRSTKPSRRDRRRYAGYARETDRRVNIRISSGDLETIRKKALEEGLPYQTVISSLLHKYASSRLRED